RHLPAKSFGGAHGGDQIAAQWDVGSRNIEFVKKFLDIEQIPIVAQHVGGHLARQLRFMPTNGKVFLQLMDEQASVQVDHRQRQVGSRVALETLRRREEAVTLF
ncbi:MAG: chemotaxis protein CheD, partial [Pirellulaceae bacterium]|nr:chemotaxis protein CheD [Pirellulaceae bacterium]